MGFIFIAFGSFLCEFMNDKCIDFHLYINISELQFMLTNIYTIMYPHNFPISVI